MMALLWLTAGVGVAFLFWRLYRRFGADRLGEINDRRRSSSRLVGLGAFVDGSRHLDVALAVTRSTLFYENRDMQASLDLDFVREIEYDTELGTGGAVPGAKVLRLRSNSQTFEFVLPNDSVPRWHLALPPRRAVPGLVPLVAAAR